MDNPRDSGKHARADALVEGAHVQLDDGLVRNDIFLGAGLERTNRDHHGLSRRDLTGDDGLQPQHRRCRHHHRINAGLGHRAVGTAPE